MGNTSRTVTRWKKFQNQVRQSLKAVKQGKMDPQTLADTLSEQMATFENDPLSYARQMGLVSDVLGTLESDYETTPGPLPAGAGEGPPVGGRPTELMDWLTEEAFAGRDAAVSGWEDLRDSDLFSDLEKTITTGLNEDLVTDDDLAKMLASSDATLAQSYQGDMAGLQNQLGGLDPSSGVSQELGAALRFGTLQEQSQQHIGTKLDVKQLNRSALENMLQMGVGLGQTQAGIQAGLSGALLNQMPFEVGAQGAGAEILMRKRQL